jgi:hypothetical protein
VIRVGIGVHNDDGTMVNPIGTKKGAHKLSITSANILNLPLNLRHSQEYILLISIVNSKLLKERNGLEWSMCGIDETGEESVQGSLAAEFRKCEFTIELPNDDNPANPPVKYAMQLYFIIFEADWLAAQAAGFTPESTASTHPCPNCMWVSKAARKCGRGAATIQPELRTHAGLASVAGELKKAKLSRTILKERMAAAGINKLTCVLQPDRIPGVDSVRDKPPDIMHVYGAGIN